MRQMTLRLDAAAVSDRDGDPRGHEIDRGDGGLISTLCLKKTRHQTLAHNFPKC